MGYNIYPPESELRDIGRDDLENKHLANAYSAFSANLSNHPESQLANASMGDYFNTKNDYAKASFFYNKALQIKEDRDIRKKLNALTVVLKKTE
jgi:Tfp pilus assembly protein PilF